MEILPAAFSEINVGFMQPTAHTDDGDCFEVAFNLLTKDHDEDDEDDCAELVHGWPRLRRKPFCHFAHAWVEAAGMVWDLANGRTTWMPVAAYYSIGNIDPKFNQRYDVADAFSKARHYKHYGPWRDGPSDADRPKHEPPLLGETDAERGTESAARREQRASSSRERRGHADGTRDWRPPGDPADAAELHRRAGTP